MARSKNARKAASLRKALQDQGRTVAWLAKEAGYSRGYVSNVLHDKAPWTDEFQRRAIEALKTGAAVPVLYRGRTIQIPESIYKGHDLPEIVVTAAYEEAWKRSWLQEHAESVLAIACDRVWQIEKHNSAHDAT